METVEKAIYQMGVTGADQVDQAAKSLDNMAASEEKVTKATRTTTDGVTKLIAQYDSATKALLQYQAKLDQINRFEQEGIGTTQDRAKALDLVTQRYNAQIEAVQKTTGVLNDNSVSVGKAAVSTGQMRFAVQQLGFQLNDVATGLLSGQSPFRIAAQQTGQFVQAFEVGGGPTAVLKAFGEQLKGLVTPTTAAIAALAAVSAAVIALGVHAYEQSSALKQLNLALGQTGDSEALRGLEAGSKALQNLGVSAADANKEMADLARNPIFNPSQGALIANVGANIGARLGITPDEGVKTLIDAATSGVNAVIQLGVKLKALDDQEIATLTKMAATGDQRGAVARGINDIATAAAGATKQLPSMTLAMNNLRTSWQGLIDLSSKNIAWFSEAMVKGLTTAIDGLAASLSKLPTEFPNGTTVGQGSTNIYGSTSGQGAGNIYGTTSGQPAATTIYGSTSGAGSAAQGANPEIGFMQPRAPLAPPIMGTGQQGTAAPFVGFTGNTASAMPNWYRPGTWPGAYGMSTSNDYARGGHGDPGGDINPATGQHIDIAADPAAVERSTEAMTRYDQQADANLKIAQAQGIEQQRLSAYFSQYFAILDTGAGEWKAVEAAQTAYNAVTKQTSAQAQTEINLQNEQSAGAVKVADAYGKSEVAGIQAAAAEQARIDAITKGANASQAYAAILQTQAADAIKASAQSIPALQLQVKETQNLADATAKGATEAHEAGLENQVLTATHDALQKAIATGNPALIEAAKNTQALVEQQIRANDAAQTALQLRQAELNNTNQIEILEKEASLQGQTSEEIQRQVSLLQAKQLLQSKGVDLASDQAQKYLQSFDALGKANIALGEASRNSQRINDTLTGIGQTIDSDITQNLEAAFSGQKIQSWGAIFKSVMAQIQAQLISLSFIKPAIGSVLSILGFSGAASQFGTFGSLLGGTSGLLGGLGSLFGGSSASSTTSSSGTSANGVTLKPNSDGTFTVLSNGASAAKSIFDLGGGGSSGGGFFGGISNFINDKIGTSLGFAGSNVVNGTGAGEGIFTNLTTGATSDIAGSGVSGGLFGGSTLTGALGFAGLGGTIGSLAGQLLGFGNQGIGGTVASGAGGLLGGLGGSALLGGAFGGPIGAIVGGLAGQLLSGLFGGKPSNNEASGSLDIGSGAVSAGRTSSNDANNQALQGIVGPISQAIQNINSILGASILPEETLVAQAGTRDGLKAGISGNLPGGGVSFTASNQADLNNQIAQFLYTQIDTSKLGATLGKIVSGLTLDQLQDSNLLQEAVSFATTYDNLKTAADAALSSVEKAANQTKGPFAQAMDQINQVFGQLTDEANKFGVSLGPIQDGLVLATAQLQGDFLDSLKQLSNAANGKGFLNDILTAYQNYQGQTQEASAIGLGNNKAVGDTLGQVFDQTVGSILSSLNSSQLDDVVAAFGDLNNDLPVMARAARDAAKATEAATLALNQQAFTYQSQQDFYNANGQGFLAQLRDLDKTAQTALAAASALGFGSGSAQANQIAETERLSAITILQGLNNDQMEQARQVLESLNPAFAQWVDQAKEATKVTNDAADAQQRSNDILNAGIQIRQYLNSLDTANSSFTSPESRLSAAQSQYNTQLGQAQGGDVAALQGITATAQTLLQAVQDYYASSAPGQAIFEQVKAQLAALPGVPNADNTATNPVVVAITDTSQDQVTATNNVSATVTEGATSIINQAIKNSADIVNNAAAGSASIAGATTIAAASINTTAVSSFSALTAANENQSAALIAQSAADANAIVLSIKQGAASSPNDPVVQALAADTSGVVNAIFASSANEIGAIYGAGTNIIGAIGAETANIVAWDQNISNWLTNVYNAINNVNSTLVAFLSDIDRNTSAFLADIDRNLVGEWSDLSGKLDRLYSAARFG